MSAAWTLCYWVNGKQVEKPFQDELHNGRVMPSPGRTLVQDFRLRLTVDKRSVT